MLPAGAVTVILLLNAVQIHLPAPAFVHEGRAWLPARPVLERAGAQVGWDGSRRALEVKLAGREALFPIADAPTVNGTALPRDNAPVMHGATVYLPAATLRELGFHVNWDPVQRQLTLVYSAQTPRKTTISAILADPDAWRGQRVLLSGEYLGWSPYPFSYATRGGPPVQPGDWVLRDDSGAVYCTPETDSTRLSAPGLARLPHPGLAFSPYEALGRRLQVEGIVALTAGALPYLRFTAVSPQPLPNALTALLALPERFVYSSDERVTLLIRAAADRELLDSFTVTADELVVTVHSPSGTKQQEKHSLKGRWSTIESQQAEIVAAIELDCNLKDTGRYVLQLRIADMTVRCEFNVEQQSTSKHDAIGLERLNDD